MKVGKANYLVIRLGDNDFTTFAESLANALSAMFYLFDYPKTEADLELLKEPVARLWAALDIVNDVMGIVQQAYPNTVKIDYDNAHTREINDPDVEGISANQSDVSFLRNKKVGIRQKNNLKRRPIFAKLLVTLR